MLLVNLCTFSLLCTVGALFILSLFLMCFHLLLLEDLPKTYIQQAIKRKPRRLYQPANLLPFYAPKAWTPPAPLHPVITSGPFCKWAIGFMVECNPPSSDGHKYIILAVNYFTKWAEAMPILKNIATTDCSSFIL